MPVGRVLAPPAHSAGSRPSRRVAGPGRSYTAAVKEEDTVQLIAEGLSVELSPFSAGGSLSGHSASRTGTDRLVAIGIAATTGIVLAGSAAQLIGYGLFHGRVPALNSASDGGLFGLIGNVSIATATLAAWIVLLRIRPRTVAMVTLPLVLSFLTIDKVFRLHDHVPGWLVFYLPLLAATFLAIAAVARRLSPRCFRLTAIALALLVGSFLLHQYGEWLLVHVGGSTTGWMFQVKAVVKHGLEVAGWFLIALGLAVGLREHDDLRLPL